MQMKYYRLSSNQIKSGRRDVWVYQNPLRELHRRISRQRACLASIRTWVQFPSAHVKTEVCVSVISTPRRQGQADLWGVLAVQANLLDDLQVSGGGRNITPRRVVPVVALASTHKYTHAHLHTNKQTHGHTQDYSRVNRHMRPANDAPASPGSRKVGAPGPVRWLSR